jgi:asparagine synthase (glutamine-hydrolysing)
MIADVPLGAFLSGGVDSSTVVALMQAQSAQRVKTFSIGFLEAGYDEAPHARAVAKHLGTDHTELYVTADEARDVIPRLPCMYDEPFGDSSQIPTFLVSQLARRHVTVSLSGDGGDELFGGYNRYAIANLIWKRTHWLPVTARRQCAQGILRIQTSTYDRWLGWLRPLIARMGFKGPVGDKIHTLSSVLESDTPDALYQKFTSGWKRPAEIVLNGHEALSPLSDRSALPNLAEFVHRMMYIDLTNYLPSDILTKVDRASMAVSLEARVPLLDHRVVEFSWQLPLAYTFSTVQRKRVLRSVLYRYVPPVLIERPKMGFGLPIDTWLRGPLREWAETLLDPCRLRNQGLLDPVPIRAMWDEHVTGRRSRQDFLWDVLMFQAWYDHWC